ncbi:MmgE/PrpD family protein [Salinibacterium sp. ZJ454]|uniref:MmgE/PrpD family protein n=1 Tax=Salinibacterium sp. ZJ454 TaxID=2708339 RepID=UPI0014246EF0|nr:MmgE/PrpD family protein [Salinibacterium sp. ZJ454]
MTSTAEMTLSAPTLDRALAHTLDTVAAIVSGATLEPGRLATAITASRRDPGDVTVVGDGSRTSARNAAFANGVAAHADETDDSHEFSKTHPGAAVVPTALAMGQAVGASGLDVLKAVRIGYDMCTTFSSAVWARSVHMRPRSELLIGAQFGALGAAIALSGADEQQARYALAYGVQRASGTIAWLRDLAHVQKGVDFGGFPGQSAIEIAELVTNGFTGVRDILDGEPNIFEVLGENSDPSLFDQLGVVDSLSASSIKKYSVGYPAQAPVDAMIELTRAHEFDVADVIAVRCIMPQQNIYVIGDRTMPNIDLRYLLTVALVDRGLGFRASHDHERFHDPAVRALRDRVTLLPDNNPETRPAHLVGYPARIEIELESGEVLRGSAGVVRGRFENPMPYEEVEQKCAALLWDCTLDPDPLLAAMRRLPRSETLDDLMTAAALPVGVSAS